MRTRKTIIAAFFSLLMIQSCYATDDQVSMYVLVPPEKMTAFTQELASLVEQLGLKAQLGGHSDDRGHTIYGLVAEGRGMSVWGQNTYVRVDADPTQCGKVSESYPDPGQYVIDVVSGLSNVVPDVNSDSSAVSESSVAKLAEDIKNGLTNLGYEVRDDALTCSPWAKSGGD